MTTVLLVDDQLELLAVHHAALAARGYRVVTAADGIDAVRTARESRPDVVVLDHSLPGLTGIQVTARLREDPATREIPVILLTAHSYGAVGRKARAAGCTAFLAKPCTPRRLIQEIERHLAGSGAGAR